MMDSAAERATQLNIREMTVDDLEGVLAIDRNTVGSDRVITYAFSSDARSADSDVGGELGVSLVAEVAGEIIGFLLGQITSSVYEMGDTAWVYLMEIDARYQRRGLGRRLMQTFTERCQEQGIRSVHITVRLENETFLSFLRSLGFSSNETVELVKLIV